MEISSKNYKKINQIYLFCRLYDTHKQFDLAKKNAKYKTLSWKQAEEFASFYNEYSEVVEAKPQSFILAEEEKINKAIDKYLNLKNCLSEIKDIIGAKNKNQFYKAVKIFYRQKNYSYEMITFYSSVINGLYLYSNRIISYKCFLQNYCFKISLFSGKKSSVDIKEIIEISNCILNLLDDVNKKKL